MALGWNNNYSDGKTTSQMGMSLNGQSVIDPSVMEFTISDVSASDAGRDEKAEMHPMKIAEKKQYKLEWNMIDPYNAYLILHAIRLGAGETFSAYLLNPVTNSYESSTYYVGDRTAPMQQWFNAKDGQLYQKISFTLIEV